MQSSHHAAHAPPATRGSFPLPDPDGDGVTEEISEGQVSALTLFLAMQEVPDVGMPQRPELVTLWSDGERRFRSIGCAHCHQPSLPLDSTRYELPSRDGSPPIVIDLAEHGADPRLRPSLSGSGYRVYLFSDLKRHVVGANLKESRGYRGVSPSEFLTRPLWGIARSRPYLHDARAPTLEDAILAHSGEAAAAQAAYAKLDEAERAAVRIYLTSLTRSPRLVAP
jgi:CxxC motif-containing protein (DUF1111 family)